MIEDEDIIAGIRRYRDEHARKFNYDIRAMLADVKSREKEGPWPLVSFDKGPREPADTGDRRT